MGSATNELRQTVGTQGTSADASPRARKSPAPTDPASTILARRTLAVTVRVEPEVVEALRPIAQRRRQSISYLLADLARHAAGRAPEAPQRDQRPEPAPLVTKPPRQPKRLPRNPRTTQIDMRPETIALWARTYHHGSTSGGPITTAELAERMRVGKAAATYRLRAYGIMPHKRGRIPGAAS